MKSLTLHLTALAASVIGYLLLFNWVHKPLTVDTIDAMMRAKSAIAERTLAPRLFVLAGSNGRFSHRCQTLEPLVGRSCVNLSVAMGIGLDYVLAEYQPLLRLADAIYLPLEYEQYLVSAEEMRRAPNNALIYRQRRDLWPELGWARVARAASSFNLSFLIQGLAEMGLQRAGVQRRYGLTTLTANGDESGHSRARGIEYEQNVRAMTWDAPNVQLLRLDSAAKSLIAAFVADMRAHGVRVIGGLPTTFDDHQVPEVVVSALRDFYREAGAEFLALDNHSQYPRRCFYDAPYHLNEECQVAHSRHLSAPLREQMEKLDRN